MLSNMLPIKNFKPCETDLIWPRDSQTHHSSNGSINSIRFGCLQEFPHQTRTLRIISHNLQKLVVLPQANINNQGNANCQGEKYSTSY